MTDEYDDDVRSFELLVDLAWDAARIGAGIIPLGPPPDYVPLCAYDRATSDALEIAELVRIGRGIAVVGGGRLLALDEEDPAKKGTDGRASIADASNALGALPPRTRRTRTKNGGEHLLFRIPDGARIRQAQEELRGYGIALPGVDVVTGAIRLPPTPGYTLPRGADVPIAMLPSAWVRALIDPPEQSRGPLRAHLREASHAHALLERAVEELAAMSSGSGRSYALNASAYRFAKFDALDDEVIVTALLGAADANGSIKKRGRRACVNIIRGGLRARARKRTA